ncbi:MAG: ArnT family glycosyltransferase [Oligoflexales bacterium]
MPAFVFIWFLFAIFLLPITTDEAYYFEWARHLAWGYLDHPPMVAWIASFSALPRLGGFLCTTATAYILIRLYRAAGLKGIRLEVAITCLLFNFAFLTLGVITTPDSALALCWALAMHETFFALRKPIRWLSTGFAVGLGMLSKYTMILFLPPLLWVIIRERPHLLKTKWPWMGFAVAILTFSPNILWNYQHDWLSFRFQWNHGFNQEKPLYESPNPTYFKLPHALPGNEKHTIAQLIPPEPNSAFLPDITQKVLQKIEHESTSLVCTRSDFFQEILQTPTIQQKPLHSFQDQLRLYLKPEFAMPTWLQSVYRLWIYIQGQFAFWGGLLFCFIFFSKRKKTHIQHHSLFRATFWFPLTFFGAVSLISHVEPNWPAMALLSAPALIATQLHITSRALRFSMVNLAIMVLALLHSHFPLQTKGDRLLKETHGFKELAAYTDTLEGPVFADKYQLVAMLNQYRKQPNIAQWPGITRYSHFLLQTLPQPAPQEFTLITTERVPPQISGYTVKNFQKIRDCLEGLEFVKQQKDQSQCRPIHIWHSLYYQKKKSNVELSTQSSTTSQTPSA